MADFPPNASAAPVPDSTISKDTKPAEATNPFAKSHTGNTSEPASSDIAKPAETPAVPVNGGPSDSLGASTTSASNGLNGSAAKTEAAMPEGNKQPSDAVPAVMTGALPLAGDHSNGAASDPLPKPSQSTEVQDGVQDATTADSASKPAPTAASILPEAGEKDNIVGAHGYKDATTGTNPFSSAAAESAPSATEEKDTAASTGLLSEDKPSTGLATDSKPDGAAPVPATTEKQDVEMTDAGLPAASETSKPDKTAAPTSTAPVSDVSGVAGATATPMTTPALATPATAGAEATGTKRKADADEVEEPAAKKHKGTFAKVMDKAKEAVEGVKDKAKPGRKPGKKAKKEAPPPPVGRTARKTRSQARAGDE